MKMRAFAAVLLCLGLFAPLTPSAAQRRGSSVGHKARVAGHRVRAKAKRAGHRVRKHLKRAGHRTRAAARRAVR